MRKITLPLLIILTLTTLSVLNYRIEATISKTIPITKDAHICSDIPTTNRGSATYISVSHVSAGKCNILIYFSLSGIPSNANILSAKLILYKKKHYSYASGKTFKTFYVYRVTKHWSEGYVTWNKRTSTSSWSTPGGDYATPSIAHFNVYTSDPNKTKYEIDITNLVKSYLAGTYKNYGVIIKAGISWYGGVQFYSSESPLIQYRPKLIVTYETPGDFSMSFNPPTITVSQGSSGSSTLQVSFSGGFSGPVTLSVQSKPSGFTVEITLHPGTGTATVAVSVASTVSPGTYSVVIRGSDGGKVHTATLTVNVVATGFTLAINPPSINIQQGSSGTASITVNPMGGFSQTVTLSVQSKPSGFTVTINPSSITPGSTATITISVDSTVSPGTYSVVIRGAGGGKTATASLSITVTEIPFDFTISVSPSSVEINQGESTTLVVTVTKTSGTAKTVSLTLIGLPSGASYSFNPSSVTPTGSSVLTINSGSAKGTYTLLVKGTADGLEKTATFTLTIKEKKCIIATVTYGSEVSNEVNLLRRFRDDIVLNSYAGQQFYKAFNAFYYSWSPYIAQIIHENGWLKTPFKTILYPLIQTLLVSTNIAQPTTPLNQELTVYLAGTMISAMLGIIYLLPILTLFKSRTGLKYNKYSIYIPITTLILCVIAQILCLTFPLTLLTSIYVLSIIIATPSIILRIVGKYIK